MKIKLIIAQILATILLSVGMVQAAEHVEQSTLVDSQNTHSINAGADYQGPTLCNGIR